MVVVNEPKKTSKVRWSFIILLITVLVAVAVWLSLGLGGQIMGDYLKQNYVKATHGLAMEEPEVDSHVSKVHTEYETLLELADSQNPDGVFEMITAGDYSYEKLEPELPGQYTISSTIIYPDEATAKKVYDKFIETLTSIGYEQDPEIEPTESTADLLRMFNAADEASEGAPGDDHIVLQYYATGENLDKTKITFFYSGTETPLAGIPYEKEEITVKDFDALVEKVVAGEIDQCAYEPNGIIGGWYPEYECLPEYL